MPGDTEWSRRVKASAVLFLMNRVPIKC